MANFMPYHVLKFQLHRICTFSATKDRSFWSDQFGSPWVPPFHSNIFMQLFFNFWDSKKRTTASWSVNFSRYFDVSSSKFIFFPKNFHFFLTDLIKKFEKNSKTFFKLKTCNWYLTPANFVLYHVVKFQLNWINTFFAIYKRKFHF